ncbi:MAG: sugar phosphate isomerase/epimerase family protein [Promethearchaeota archaeon]|jgi:sugar phosphate isomerase/epimerase
MKSKIGGSLKKTKQDLILELQNLKIAGYDFAELDLGFPLEPNKALEDELKTVRNIIPILSGHLPEIDFKKEGKEKCKKFIEILSDQGTNLFVIHLFSQNLSTKDNLDLKIKTLNELADYAKRKDCSLVLENTEEDSMTLKKVFVGVPKLNFCLDIGHANLLEKGNHSINLINKFGNILNHIHMHDNVGGDSVKHDLHLPVGEGKIDFKPIFMELKEIKYAGNITLELYNADMEARKLSIKRARELIK